MVLDAAAASPTNTTLTSTPNPSGYGQTINFIASVDGNAPTGYVDFNDGPNTVCAFETVIDGQAACSVALQIGAHTMTASYSGDPANAPSISSAYVQQINKAETTAVLGSDFNPINDGGTATIFVTVTGKSPSGDVTFYDDSAVVCSTRPLSSGSAACAVSGLSPGSHPLTVAYSGDVHNAASTSNVLAEMVLKSSGAATSTSLDTNCTKTFVENEPFTMTATVTGSAPTGNVSFLTQDSVALCANVPLDTGVVSCQSNALAVSGSATEQSYNLTAYFGGDASNAGSESAAISILVLSAQDVVFRDGMEEGVAGCVME